MTTEDKALALVNEVCAEWEVSPATEDDIDGSACFSALTRAIEQHEAFRQEVSDAVEHYRSKWPANARRDIFDAQFGSFVIAKPEMTREQAATLLWECPDDWTVSQFREHLEQRGYKHEVADHD